MTYRNFAGPCTHDILKTIRSFQHLSYLFGQDIPDDPTRKS